MKNASKIKSDFERGKFRRGNFYPINKILHRRYKNCAGHMRAKALQDKTLVRKSSKYKGAMKTKQRLTTAFFVAADRTKVGEPVVI